MAGGGLPFDDWLLLAGNPADSGLHFVGTFDRRITFYSQQVRALRLVHALSRLGNLQPTDHIAVVGAGAAGVMAAIGLALLGNDVMLYDPAGSILQLQSASPRLLHPKQKRRKRGKTSGDRGGAARVRAFSGRLTNRLSRRRFCAGQPAAQRVLTRAGRLGTSIALGTLSLAPR